MTGQRWRNLVFALVFLASTGDHSFAEGNLTFSGYARFWIIPYEQVENGIRQAGSNEESAQSASGFNLRMARIQLASRLFRDRLSFHAMFKFENNPGLLDFYATWHAHEWFNLSLGQMKIPSTYETLVSARDIDFIDRSNISKAVADWSLSQTPYTSPFRGLDANQRDLGISAKGVILNNRFRYFFMVGNGLGANLFIGGKQEKEYAYTNSPGDYFYGLRCEWDLTKWLKMGTHISINDHDNMLFNDEKTVFDLHRRSYSGDVHVMLPSNIFLTGLYAAGVVDDNYYRDDKENYSYSGWELKVLWMTPWSGFQVCGRCDTYVSEFNESGEETGQYNWTLGLNYQPNQSLKLQGNYIYKDTRSEYQPDLADNIFFLNIQVSFSTNSGDGTGAGSP